jgi:hypothetical protein
MKLPDKDFIAYVSAIDEQCTEHSLEWDIDSARLSALTILVINAKTAYEANMNKATCNHITSINKRSAFDDLKHFLATFIDYLEGNLSVPDEALAIMSLRPRVHRAYGHNPRPEEAPVLNVVKQHYEMTVYVARAKFGHPTQTITQKSYGGFKLRWRFEGETVYHTEASTSLHYTIRFERGDEAKRVEISAAWMNTRLEEGPWSASIVEIVG